MLPKSVRLEVRIGPSEAEESEVEKEQLRLGRGQGVADICLEICSESRMFRLRLVVVQAEAGSEFYIAQRSNLNRRPSTDVSQIIQIMPASHDRSLFILKERLLSDGAAACTIRSSDGKVHGLCTSGVQLGRFRWLQTRLFVGSRRGT